jgi:hypothetical protein
MNFIQFFNESEEEEKNVLATIKKLPKKHQKLLHGYKFKYTPGNTLKGDDQHIGYIHNYKIVVAAPWNYSREFTTLHEIAHLIYEYIMTTELKKEWEKLFKKEKINMTKCSALDQNSEEIFCMVYAATYAKHPPKTYMNKNWQSFIKRLP